jgi:hypothetical protein
MKNLNLRGRHGERTEKEKPILISKEKVTRFCLSNYHPPSGSIVNHTKEVFSDGWTKWIMSHVWPGEVHNRDDIQGGNVK